MICLSLKSCGREPFSKDDSHVGPVQVTAVGMSTEWGKLMATISEDNDEETPLQVGNGSLLQSFIQHFVASIYLLITYEDELLLLFMLSFCLYLWCSNADFLLSFK